MRSNRFSRRKKRSGWKHPLDINRNHRRCEKRRRSASVRARLALQELTAQESLLELIEARAAAAPQRTIGRGAPDRRGPERRPARRLEPRRAW